MAKNEEEVKDSVFGFGKSNEAFAKFFLRVQVTSNL